MVKRSPILGYNHNVRYRGLIFHVQTEDSGLMNPHLFSHLFHEGTIVSTRKLVYDSGSDEGAIKSLMQAQHKAVMKDLKRGHFDDKIDLYLGHLPGLLPRGETETADEKDAKEALRLTSENAPLAKPTAKPAETIGGLGPAGAPANVKPPQPDDIDAPTLRTTEPPPISSTAAAQNSAAAQAARATRPGIGPVTGDAKTELPTKSRTITAERGSKSAIASAAPRDIDPMLESSAKIAAATRTLTDLQALDSSPEIEIQLGEEDEASGPRRRKSHDTEVQPDGLPGEVIDDHTRKNEGPAYGTRPHGESIPPLPPPPDSKRATGERPAVGAATLPPARPITRPPGGIRPTPAPITPPAVVSRPMPRTADASNTDSVEVYAPPPSATDPAPERPGQYAQHRRSSVHIPTDSLPVRERTQSVPIPSGLGTPPARPPGRPITGAQPPIQRPGTGPVPTGAIPQVVDGAGSQRARTPTPARMPNPNAPRTGTPGASGVVMTRPAVIVGAPAKPANAPRVRKAREEEGRGFGQGLISEKSLDEVILAYLSEDADDK